MKEVWKPVASFEGLYAVSNMGSVKSARVRRGSTGSVLAASANSEGYLRVDLFRDGRRTRRFVHQLVIEAFIGPCPEGMEVLHGPGGRRDNRITNLSYGTHSANQGPDRARDHRTSRGERSGNAKLTWVQVCELRKLWVNGASRARLSEQFKISQWQVTSITRGHQWRYPPKEW